MLLSILSILTGLVILVWSADRFVLGAAATAKNLGMSPMLIGLTIVAFGTSAPEMLVSLTAALEDAGNLAIGNAVGSNIANIGLVLGITALIAPLPVKSGVLKKEIPLLLGITLIAGYVLHDFILDFKDGILLFTSLALCLFIFAKYQHSGAADDHLADEAEEIPEMKTSTAVFWLVIGLSLLIASSKMLVWGATQVAIMLGVSDLIIGLTIVAIGTSLPELAASITSALKNHHDIALGNVVGSNIFNLAAVMALPGFVDTLAVEEIAFNRDYLVMLCITLVLIVFCLLQKPARISRTEGGFLTLAYAGYMAMLYTTSI